MLLLLGDSDISNWPKELLPNNPSTTDLISNATSGAKLSDVVSMVHSSITNIPKKESPLIFVACAGENDISSGRTVTKTLVYFNEFLNTVYNEFKESKKTQHKGNKSQCYLIFLGPKLEPWLKDNSKYRKKYQDLSDGMKRVCKDHQENKSIIFIECLDMFCAKSETTVLNPDEKYFRSDGLHLSDLGYMIWKEKVEFELNCISDSL